MPSEGEELGGRSVVSSEDVEPPSYEQEGDDDGDDEVDVLEDGLAIGSAGSECPGRKDYEVSQGRRHRKGVFGQGAAGMGISDGFSVTGLRMQYDIQTTGRCAKAILDDGR